MLLTPVIPLPQLAPFIQSCWIFESSFGNPLTSSRVIAPNGSVNQRHPEGRIQFIGNADEP